MHEENINLHGWCQVIYGFHSPLVKKLLGRALEFSAADIANDSGHWGVLWENWLDLGKRTNQRIVGNMELVGGLLAKHHEIGKHISAYCQRLEKDEFSKLTNEKILTILQKLWDQGQALSAYGFFPVVSDFEHSMLSDRMLAILKNKGVLETNRQNYLSLLSYMNRQTLYWQEKLELLELAEKDRSTKAKQSPNFQKHVQKYNWLNFGFQGPEWTSVDFLSRIAELRSKGSLKKQTEEHSQSLKKLQKDQAALEARLRLNPQEKAVFETARTFMYLKSYRVEVRHRINYILELLFSELGKRFKLPRKFFRYAIPSEITALISGKAVHTKKILNRDKGLLFLMHGQTDTFIPQTQIKKYLRDYSEKQTKIKADYVSGQTAYNGKVRGIARLVFGPKDNHKVKKGEIIIAITTTPDVLPAMTRASAFVTDQGGITSHAAIVAREMQKPCVIATKIATQVFRDGDMVEVDANKGVVRKV